MKIAYESWRPGAEAIEALGAADAICADYQRQGYDLTLRQLYYQFVARGLIPNNMRSYKRLGDIVNRGRMAGYLDWDHIVDRTRNLQSLPHWRNPGRVIRSAAASYNVDTWSDQDVRVEVWVEKEALAGVVDRAATSWDCSWFSCRGYVSQSEMWGAAQRLGGYIRAGQAVTILHLGDHDPSGIDMTRDITERIQKFIAVDWEGEPGIEYDEMSWQIEDSLNDTSLVPFTVNRIALNMDQVRRYDPPPNPAKLTDSRAEGYISQYGVESWELDALDPSTLDALISEHIAALVDMDKLEARREAMEAERDTLNTVADQWSEVAATFGR